MLLDVFATCSYTAAIFSSRSDIYTLCSRSCHLPAAGRPAPLPLSLSFTRLRKPCVFYSGVLLPSVSSKALKMGSTGGYPVHSWASAIENCVGLMSMLNDASFRRILKACGA